MKRMILPRERGGEDKIMLEFTITNPLEDNMEILAKMEDKQDARRIAGRGRDPDPLTPKQRAKRLKRRKMRKASRKRNRRKR